MWGTPIQLREELEYTYTTDAEWDREEASEIGYANPDQAWIVTGRDVVHANPFYRGWERPHPEADFHDYPDGFESWDDFWSFEQFCTAIANR